MFLDHLSSAANQDITHTSANKTEKGRYLPPGIMLRCAAAENKQALWDQCISLGHSSW